MTITVQQLYNEICSTLDVALKTRDEFKDDSIEVAYWNGQIAILKNVKGKLELTQ